MALTTGYVLNNRYRVVKLLGQGGFGAIYRAWDLNLSNPCAIKHNTETSAQAERQFVREATLLANLNHPHLPRVYDYFFQQGQGQYLVMDFIEGEDLQEKLDKAAAAAGAPTPLPDNQVIAWIQQVCDALSYLHHLNPPIIHRDIKPGNIRINPDGKAYLVDFGIAKVYNPHIATTIAAKAVTPGYSPPEQYSGTGTDVRTDIYALGATLYSLLTGAAPPESVFRSTGHETLRLPRSLNPAITPAVQDVIMKAMEISSTGRFQRIEDFQAALNNPYFTIPAAPTARAPSETVVQSYAPPVQVYPVEAAPPYQPSAAPPYQPSVVEQMRSSGVPWPVFVIGAMVLICLVLGGIVIGGGGAAGLFTSATDTEQPPESTQGRPVNPTDTPIPPTDVPPPTATARPTDTLPRPTDTTRPTEPPPPPTATRAPTNTPVPPTSPPVSNNVSVRIRNRTGGPANLYRFGTSGETHFLGWLNHGFYGIYTFPSLGEWTIQYCKRDENGDSFSCDTKTINVTASDQEFNVP